MKVYTKIKDYTSPSHAVVTVGTFDGVHLGHQALLSKMKDIAKKTNGETVLLTFYPHPRMVLFPESVNLKLLNTLKEKTDLLESFGLDHLIILPFNKKLSRMNPTEYVRDLLVRDIGVKTLVIGYDHRFGKNREGDFQLLDELSHIYGYALEEISAQELNDIKISSTKVRNAILKGDIQKAEKYSGHSFFVTGRVVEGSKIGRKIGFPTANIEIPDEHKIIPANGAYAVRVFIDGKKYNGMLNVGNRPTIETMEKKQTIEINIFHFNENIYNKIIQIEFVKRLRDEIAFANLDALKEQLKKDKNQSLEILT